MKATIELDYGHPKAVFTTDETGKFTASLRDMSTSLCLHHSTFDMIPGNTYWISASTNIKYLSGIIFELTNRITGDVSYIEKIFNDNVASNLIYADAYDVSAWFAYKDCCLDEVYSISNIEGWEVLDVGAHIGMFSRMVAEKGARRIISVEPCSGTYGYLKLNLNKYRQVNMVNFALAADTGILRKMFIDYNNSASDSFYGDKNQLYESVGTVNVNEFLESFEHFNLAKFNVEGAEEEIFQEVSDINLSRIDKVIVCYHSPKAKKAVVDRFNSAKFKYEIVPKNEDRGMIHAVQHSNELSQSTTQLYH